MLFSRVSLVDLIARDLHYAAHSINLMVERATATAPVFKNHHCTLGKKPADKRKTENFREGIGNLQMLLNQPQYERRNRKSERHRDIDVVSRDELDQVQTNGA